MKLFYETMVLEIFCMIQGYGIAMAQSISSYKPLIDAAILHVQETGALHKLNVKWWKQKRGGGIVFCDVSNVQ